MFKIGNVEIFNCVCLAPMAGTSNAAYMKICEEMGVGFVVTELISSEAIVRGNVKTFDMLNGLDDLTVPFGVQIFGSNPIVMANAARKICEYLPSVSFIDINMGCPVPKVALKNCAGSALLKNVDLVFDIVSSVVNAVSVPVTVKIRSGWDSDSVNAVLVARKCEEAGASAIAVHGRTRAQGYSGSSDWNVIKLVKDAVSIPVIGNGDIKSCYDAKRMMDETFCDGVMIGRAALGNPWIIRDCVRFLNGNDMHDEVSLCERVDMIKKHYFYLKKYSNEKSAILEIRMHALWYIKGISGAKRYKEKIVGCFSEDEFFSVLDTIKSDLF